MKKFAVPDDLVELVWRRAEPKPFEKLEFHEALRRVLGDRKTKVAEQPVLAEDLLAELAAMDEKEFATKHPNYEKPRRRVRAPSPRPDSWLPKVAELSSMPHLRTWQDICNHLRIDVGGDSARRKLAEWVTVNRPKWPPVPAPEA